MFNCYGDNGTQRYFKRQHVKKKCADLKISLINLAVKMENKMSFLRESMYKIFPIDIWSLGKEKETFFFKISEIKYVISAKITKL